MGSTGPGGGFEGQKRANIRPIYPGRLGGSWCCKGPGLGLAPGPSPIRTFLRAWTEGWLLSNSRPKFDTQISIGQRRGHGATGRGVGNTLVSVCAKSAFARANSALRIDKFHRWLFSLVLIADSILQGWPA